MLIDTHCHLNDSLYDDLENLMDRITKSDIGIIIISGYDVKSSERAIEMTHIYKNVYATVGFQPCDGKDVVEDDYKKLSKWVKEEKVVGIGEIGLDNYYDDDKDRQQEMFRKQVDIAVKYNKPIVVHNREASEDIYNILKESGARGIIHCFNDNLEMANKFISLGFLLGIGGIVTFKKNNLNIVLEDISPNAIVLETDSPYLSPEPLRGKINNPLNLKLIAEKIATIKNMSYEDIALITTDNARQLFDFTPDLWYNFTVNYRGGSMSKKIPILVKVTYLFVVFLAVHFLLPLDIPSKANYKNNTLDINMMKYNAIPKDLISERTSGVFFGKLTGYGPKCYGCEAITASGFKIIASNIYYNDKIYGEVRIVAADKKIKMGSIYRVTAPQISKIPFLVIVLDRGGPNIVGNTFDLLFDSEDNTNIIGVQRNVKYELLRKGW